MRSLAHWSLHLSTILCGRCLAAAETALCLVSRTSSFFMKSLKCPHTTNHDYSVNRNVWPSRPFISAGQWGAVNFMLLSPSLGMLLVIRWPERVSICVQLGSWSHLRPPTTCPHLDLWTWMATLSPRPDASCSPAASFEQEVLLYLDQLALLGLELSCA